MSESDRYWTYCPACDDRFLSRPGEPLTECPECQGPLQKLVSGVLKPEKPADPRVQKPAANREVKPQ